MKEYIESLISKTLKELDINYEGSIEVESIKNQKMGDYASNIAMKLASHLKTNPRDIANKLIANINSDKFTKIEVAGPGFINFYINPNILYDNINTILKEKENYGKSEYGKDQRVIVEYVSANPTGLLHIGHARGAAYGDAISRIKAFAGHKVTREYYINDAGKQMENLGLSVQARYLELFGIHKDIPENGYVGEEIKGIALSLKEEKGDSLKEESVDFFREYGCKKMLEQIAIDLKNFNVSFDIWSSENEAYKSGRVLEVIEKLKATGETYEDEGALYLKTSKYGDDKDRVLIKSDGSYTYFLPDIAEHLSKYNHADKLIDVLGADHHGYINRMKSALNILGHDPESLEVEILQMVRMVKDGVEVKMSKRTGNAYTIQDLLEDVGVNAARYFFAAKSQDTQMDFDLELATKKSSDNPVYYINYAYARINSIIKNYEEDITVKEYTTLNENALELLNKLYSFQETVLMSSIKQAPHIIANYLYDLATLFHAYYAKERFISEDINYTNERINLLKATAIVLKSALNLIGVSAMEEM